jgi:outer membrane protein assembly factor BamE
MLKHLISIFSTAAVCLLPACAIHKLDIQQGNVVDEAMLKQLHTGMNKRQVKFVLGTPLLEDPFHEDRWDYVYMYTKNNKIQDKRHLTLFFTGDALTKYVTVPDDPRVWAKKPETSSDDSAPESSEPADGGDHDAD